MFKSYDEMRVRYKYLIIGGGPTGLGAAYRLKEMNERDFLILEKASYLGGLSASFVDEKGFTWDLGGHVQFSHYEYFDQVMDRALGKDGWLKHERSAWAFLDNRFIPYPVQNNIRYFSKEKIWKCIDGLIEVNQNLKKIEPRNFRDWILYSFGPGLAEVFMLDYNYKVWAHPPERMSFEWVGERVAVSEFRKLLKNIMLEQDDVKWGPNSIFRFPKEGGTGAIWKAVASQIGTNQYRLRSEVKWVDYEAKQVTLVDGTQLEYEHLLSTMPLPVLCNKLKPEVPRGPLQASKKLLYSSSNIVCLGMHGKVPEALKDKNWIYFSEHEIPFYRATILSNFSPKSVPDPDKYWSLMTETSESLSKPVNQENLVKEVIQACIRSKFISKEDEIASIWSRREVFGYPTPSLDRDMLLNQILPKLDALGIFSRGRFGVWKYEISNQDHSFMQGVEWANRIVRGVPEKTIQLAAKINAIAKKIAA